MNQPIAAGVLTVEDARVRWNIPTEVVTTPPQACPDWTRDMAAAVERLLAPATPGDLGLEVPA